MPPKQPSSNDNQTSNVLYESPEPQAAAGRSRVNEFVQR